MLNFISNDYDALGPFQSSAAVKALRASYIVIVTILFLNTLIAMLNLKIKRADKNAGNLYHLQMASLQIEIELGLLSASERRRRDWFPEWFSYSMSETEKRVWEDYVEKNSLKWLEENSFDEGKDHAPLIPLETKSKTVQQESTVAPSSIVATKVSSSTTKPDTEKLASSSQCSSGAEPSQSQVSKASSSSSSSFEYRQTHNHDSNSTTDPNAVKSPPDSNTSQPRQEEQPDTAEEQISSNTELPCKLCGKLGKRCTGCRTVAYCGREHQRQDWESHKGACKGKGKA